MSILVGIGAVKAIYQERIQWETGRMAGKDLFDSNFSSSVHHAGDDDLKLRWEKYLAVTAVTSRRMIKLLLPTKTRSTKLKQCHSPDMKDRNLSFNSNFNLRTALLQFICARQIWINCIVLVINTSHVFCFLLCLWHHLSCVLFVTLLFFSARRDLYS